MHIALSLVVSPAYTQCILWKLNVAWVSFQWQDEFNIKLKLHSIYLNSWNIIKIADMTKTQTSDSSLSSSSCLRSTVPPPSTRGNVNGLKQIHIQSEYKYNSIHVYRYHPMIIICTFTFDTDLWCQLLLFCAN